MFRTAGKPGLSIDDAITELDAHRHRGFDIGFIIQFPMKIHHEIRQLVKRHIHLVRSHGMKRSMLDDWQRVVDNPEQEESVQQLSRCWNGEGAQVQLTQVECRVLSPQPLPTSSGQAVASAVVVPPQPGACF